MILTEIIINNLYLMMLLPLWIFLIIMVGRFFAVYVNKYIIYAVTLLSSAFGVLLSSLVLWKLPNDAIIESQFQFIKLNDFIISCGLYIDRTALIFALVLFLVSLLVQIFSIYYMKNDPKNYRFFALMNLFNFSMAGLFFSPNLFQTYFFWEMVGVVSYFLIGFDYFKQNKSLASKKVFIINRIGDTALISAVITTAYYIYTYSNNYHLTTLSFSDMNIISTLLYAYTSTPIFYVLCGLFMLAILVKSAQFPFYTWLQDAMEAKLPVSALLHSATMVASGVFLTLRLMPFFTIEPVVIKVLALFGLITAIICSISACAQNHPKKALAYSTSAQLGLMFFVLGVLNIKACIAFFIAHAFIKSTLFLTLPKEDKKWDYFNFIGFLISGLSLSGLIFSGLLAKEMMFMGLGVKSSIIFCILAFLTAFYIIRIALVLYDENKVEKNKPQILELIAVGGLLLLNILFYIYLHKTAQYKIAEPFWVALSAWIVVYVLYVKKWFFKIPIVYHLAVNGFYLDEFYTKICVKVYEMFANLLDIIDTKILANYKPIIWLSKKGVNVVSLIENNVMNGSVNLVKNSFKKVSEFDLKAQTGNVQKYNAYALIIITVVLVCLILAYSAIINILGG